MRTSKYLIGPIWQRPVSLGYHAAADQVLYDRIMKRCVNEWGAPSRPFASFDFAREWSPEAGCGS